VYLHPRLEPVRANLLRSPLLGDGVMAAEALAEVAVELADQHTLWRPILRHDPSRRWYERLLLTSRIEIWLIGWAAGQGTRMHDHGGAHGAFAVVDGGLVEAAADARTAHRAGSVSWFGPDWVHIERNVLEWRLDPASPHRIAEVDGYDRQVIVMCSEGYSSSLAAASLQDLGLYRATDLTGGFRAWAAAGLPVRRT
jgi:rhodanese-related sulfurtransferase